MFAIQIYNRLKTKVSSYILDITISRHDFLHAWQLYQILFSKQIRTQPVSNHTTRYFILSNPIKVVYTYILLYDFPHHFPTRRLWCGIINEPKLRSRCNELFSFKKLDMRRSTGLRKLWLKSNEFFFVQAVLYQFDCRMYHALFLLGYFVLVNDI